jgi:hypothetical protein
MPDADFAREVMEAACRLISASRTGDVEEVEIAREVGREADDMDVYYALREADRRGDLDCTAWQGGLGLPAMVRLPPGR